MGGQLVTPVVEVLVRGDVDGQRSQFRRQRLIDLSEHLTERPPMNTDREHERIRGAFERTRRGVRVEVRVGDVQARAEASASTVWVRSSG